MATRAGLTTHTPSVSSLIYSQIFQKGDDGNSSSSQKIGSSSSCAAEAAVAKNKSLQISSTTENRMFHDDHNEVDGDDDILSDTASCTDDLSCCENGVSAKEDPYNAYSYEDAGSSVLNLNDTSTVTTLDQGNMSQRRPQEGRSPLDLHVILPAPAFEANDDEKPIIVKGPLDATLGTLEDEDSCEFRDNPSIDNTRSWDEYDIHDFGQDEPHPTDHLHILHALLIYMKNRDWKKKALMIFVVLTVTYIICDMLFWGQVKIAIEAFLNWMEFNLLWGILLFLCLFILCCLLFIPPSILTVGAGYVFASAFGPASGIVIATSVCFIGATIGALLSFFRARYLMRDLIKLFARRYTIAKAIDRAMKKKSFRIMLLLRLCPLIPFSAVNYIGGITGAKAVHFTLALVGMLPGQILTIFIGATASSIQGKELSGRERRIQLIAINLGLLLAFVSFVIVWYFARKELKKEIAWEQERERMHPDNRLPFDSTHHSTTGARRGSYTASESQHGEPSSRRRHRSQSRHGESPRRHRSQSRSRRPRSHSRSRRGSGHGSKRSGSRRANQRGSSKGSNRGSSRKSSMDSSPRAGASPILLDLEQPDPPLHQPTTPRQPTARGSLRVSTDPLPRRGSLSHIPRRFQFREDSGLSPSNSSAFSSPISPPTPTVEMMMTISICSTDDMGEA